MVARAFASLPQRWQAVLWHTEIEGARPAEVATLLGLTANGVAALAYRAREGLRQAYLQMHLSGEAREQCRPVAAKLGAHVRGGLAKRDAAMVAGHLDQCADCRRIYAELGDVNVALKAIVAPVVLGPAAAAYLASAAGRGSAAAWVTARLAQVGTWPRGRSGTWPKDSTRRSWPPPWPPSGWRRPPSRSTRGTVPCRGQPRRATRFPRPPRPARLPRATRPRPGRLPRIRMRPGPPVPERRVRHRTSPGPR